MRFFRRHKWLKIMVALLLLIAVERFCRWQTAGFRWEKIFPDSPLSKAENPPAEPLIKQLDQPFYFLSSGVQTYNFISKDGSLVLKLFKHYHAGASTRWLMQLPAFVQPLLRDTIAQRTRRMDHILNSAKIAASSLQEETKILYLHLFQTEELPIIDLFDKIHILHRLDLNQVEFALQKKADSLWELLSGYAKINNHEKMRFALRALFNEIEGRLSKEIASKDVKWDNFGIINDEVIEWDIGSFQRYRHLTLSKKKRVFQKTCLKLRKKFSKSFGTFINDFDDEMSSVYEKIS